MFNIYNGFNVWGDGTTISPTVVADCDATVQHPDFLLTVGTPLERLARIGGGSIISSISTNGPSCLILVDFAEASEKEAARTALLGEAPVDANGLGYDYTGV